MTWEMLQLSMLPGFPLWEKDVHDVLAANLESLQSIFRAYAAEDLYKVCNGVPHLHVYLREAEPSDVFDAGGMHCETCAAAILLYPPNLQIV